MIQGFYTARSGMMAQQSNMDIISNNIANVNTVGYKPIRASFTDLMYHNLNKNISESPAVVGTGVRINKSDLIMLPGGGNPTNYPFDFLLQDENAFFAVQNVSGEIEYTRAGSFILSNDDDVAFYLAAPNGDRVLDEDGDFIEITWDYDGNMEFDPAIIGAFRFDNPFGLLATGNNRYLETESSGIPEAIELPKLVQGSLENSGVDLSDEMVKVIEASKAFSFNSRMIQVADEVEQTVNSLR